MSLFLFLVMKTYPWVLLASVSPMELDYQCYHCHSLHFGDRIFREFPGNALTWLTNQPYTADMSYLEPGGRILPDATQSSGQYRKIESAPEASI